MKKEKNHLDRKDLKTKAKCVIKKNLWTLLFVGVLMSTIFSEYTLTRNSNERLRALNDCVVEDPNAKEAFRNGELVSEAKENLQSVETNEFVEVEINRALFGTEDGTIYDINEKYGVTHGIFYGVFGLITRSKVQLKNVINSLVTVESKLQFARWIMILISLAGLLVKIFIQYPISIGENRIFLESRTYTDTSIKRIVYGFMNKRYFKIIKSILKKNAYQALWDITIIGGWIKKYSYAMVPFIVAENPNISGKDAINISRKMMNGYKWETFKLDVSFIGWQILQILSFGIIGFWVNTYSKATYAELYNYLRNIYIKDKKEGYELLNDEKLFSNDTLSVYPETMKKKKEINYNYNYRISSIILFFFTFAFVGWLWEVLLYLFRDGIFVNRGALYGPWLPIYGISCTAIILLVTKFELFRKMCKNPFLMFVFIMVFSTIIEFTGSWLLEIISGVKYWDYTGVFLNINGRVCLECSLFFGVGGSLCLYIVAPFLESKFEKLTLTFRITVCMILVILFGIDELYSAKHPHEGDGITSGANFESQTLIELE